MEYLMTFLSIGRWYTKYVEIAESASLTLGLRISFLSKNILTSLEWSWHGPQNLYEAKKKDMEGQNDHKLDNTLLPSKC